jgi:hypothetical protein
MGACCVYTKKMRRASLGAVAYHSVRAESGASPASLLFSGRWSMRTALAAIAISALFCIAADGRSFAQQQDQSSQSGSQNPQSSSQNQGSDQPQPRKKPAAKAKGAGDSASTDASSSKGADSSSDSSQAANPKNSSTTSSSGTSSSSTSSPGTPSKAAPSKPPAQNGKAASDENPFPEAVSQAAAHSSSSTAPAASSSANAANNPFPEDVSRSAAKGQNGQKNPTVPVPPGVSSSRSSDAADQGDDIDQSGDAANSDGNAGKETRKLLAGDGRARAKKDVQVGEFYLQTGDNRGAYLRYKDALAYDPANVDAIFGLAEAARKLKLIPEAEKNYELYLQIVPDGSKAKDASKALHSLDTHAR